MSPQSFSPAPRLVWARKKQEKRVECFFTLRDSTLLPLPHFPFHSGKPSCSSSSAKTPSLPTLLGQSHANPGGRTRLALAGCCKPPPARQRIAGADIDDRLLGPAFVVSSLVACDLVRFGHPCKVVAVLQILKFECQPQPLLPQPLESVACFSSLSTPYHLSPSLSLSPLSHMVLTSSASHTEVLS